MVSVFVPIIYLAVLLGGLSTFSVIYRRRKPAPVSQLDEWFPTNTARDVYFSIQAQEGVPSGLVKSALLLRAVEDIKRLQKIQVKKTALNTLMQKGGAGDDLWRRFLQLEEEMKAEVMDVVAEAQALQEGWQQIIFATANEIYHNDQSRQILSKIMPMTAQVKAEFEQAKDVRERQLEKIKKNSEIRMARERKEAESEQERVAREAEEQRERAIQELLAMEEETKPKVTTKAGGGTQSPKNNKKKKK